mgnify:CR=1 FL=1
MSIYYDAYYGDSTTRMKSGVDIILFKLSKLELPYDIIFEIEKHVYHWIHSHKQKKILKEFLSIILSKKYKRDFPGTRLVVKAAANNLTDLKVFVAGHSGSMKKLLEAIGLDSDGQHRNTLMAAAQFERPEVLLYLIHNGVNTAIANLDGENALHISARHSVTSTRCLETLLKNMPLESINKKSNDLGWTPLDFACNSLSPIKNDIVQLIRQHGGKATCFDANGEYVGEGKGDLNYI